MWHKKLQHIVDDKDVVNLKITFDKKLLLEIYFVKIAQKMQSKRKFCIIWEMTF